MHIVNEYLCYVYECSNLQVQYRQYISLCTAGGSGSGLLIYLHMNSATVALSIPVKPLNLINHMYVCIAIIMDCEQL